MVRIRPKPPDPDETEAGLMETPPDAKGELRVVSL
jgi:hypothetical protein